MPGPNMTCMRPFSRGVMVARGVVQRCSSRVSVNARHTRSTGTSTSTRWAKLRYALLTEPAYLPRRATQATGIIDTSTMPMVTKPKLFLMTGMLPKKKPAHTKASTQAMPPRKL